MKLERVSWLAITVAATLPFARAQNFNIDVGPLGTEPSSSYGAVAGTGIWNSVLADHVTPFTTGPTPQDVMLVDIYGNQTAVGFHQYGGMDLQSVNDPSVPGNHAVLLNDYLATHSVPLENCMYLNGLENGTYEIITYAWMPNSPSTMQRVRFDFHPGDEFVGGTWTGAHVEGVTYSRKTLTITDGHIGFHVGIPSGGATSPGAAFNGMQVRRLDVGPTVPAVPKWGVAVLAVVLALVGARTVRKMSRGQGA